LCCTADPHKTFLGALAMDATSELDVMPLMIVHMNLMKEE
jgi:hypothetical protein